MHRFTRGRQAETLFRGLVGFHLGLGFGFGHDKTQGKLTKNRTEAVRRATYYIDMAADAKELLKVKKGKLGSGVAVMPAPLVDCHFSPVDTANLPEKPTPSASPKTALG